MKNTKIKAAHIAPGTSELTSTGEAKDGMNDLERQKVKERAQARTRRFTKLSDMLAGDDTCIRNWKVPKGAEMFPTEWQMQFVDLYYPNARNEKGEITPLYVDLPTMTHQVTRCERKLKVLKEKGINYTYILSGEGELEVRARMLDKKSMDIIAARKRAADEVRQKASMKADEANA